MNALIIIKQDNRNTNVIDTIQCDPDEDWDILDYKYHEYLYNADSIRSCFINKERMNAEIVGDAETTIFIIRKIK